MEQLVEHLFFLLTPVFITAFMQLRVRFDFDSVGVSYALLGYSDLLVLITAFALGAAYGVRGVIVTMIAGVMLYTLLSVGVTQDNPRFVWALSENVEFRLRWRDPLHNVEIAFMAVVFSIVGRALHERLPGLGDPYTRT